MDGPKMDSPWRTVKAVDRDGSQASRTVRQRGWERARRGRPLPGGYGPVEVDPVRLAYYHADWAIQDLVGYAERVLVTDFGPASRAEALRVFMSIFDPGGEVEVALG
jgi:hypothetical protein